jgi:hypothetical protein
MSHDDEPREATYAATPHHDDSWRALAPQLGYLDPRAAPRAAPKAAVAEGIVPAAWLGLRRAFDAVEALLGGDEAEHDTAAMFSHLA